MRCVRVGTFLLGFGWLKPRMELPRRVSVNANHRRYENRTLNFLASARYWLRVVGMNDRGVIPLKGVGNNEEICCSVRLLCFSFKLLLQ